MKRSNGDTFTQDNGYDNGRASVEREVLRLARMARWAHSKEASSRYFARALSLNAAFNAWRSGRTWAEELDTLLALTLDECGDDEDGFCLAEVSLLWAEAQAFYHRHTTLGADETRLQEED